MRFVCSRNKLGTQGHGFIKLNSESKSRQTRLLNFYTLPNLLTMCDESKIFVCANSDMNA